MIDPAPSAVLQEDKDNDHALIRETDAELRQLVEQLLSYDSLKTAVVDREEDFSPNPRFSQPLLRDVLLIVKERVNVGTTPLCTPQEVLSLVHTLVLPTTDMTIPSHAIQAVLELVVLTLSELNTSGSGGKSNNYYGSISNSNRRAQQQKHGNNNQGYNNSNDPKLVLEDAHVAQELLHKTKTMQIYYTMPFVKQEMEEWKRSLLICLNLTLNLYSNVASQIRDPEASKQVVQFAENLLMESGSTSPSTNSNRTVNSPERLYVQPDVISFNTVMTAWGKSVRRNASKVHRERNGGGKSNATSNHAAKHAAERAEAILKLLLEISQEMPSLRPTAYSYTTVMAAWAYVDTPEAAHHVMDNLLKPMVEQNLEELRNFSHNNNAHNSHRRHPSPTAVTLVTATKVLAHHDSSRELQQHVKELLSYQDKCRIPIDTILVNAILTAYVKMEPTNRNDYLPLCKNMIDFFDKYMANRKPDSVSYMLILLGIRQCIQQQRRSKNPQPIANNFAQEAQRLLHQAVATDLSDTRMFNDVLGSLCFHATEAEKVFEEMGDRVDYQSYQALLEAYESSSKMHTKQSSEYAEKAEQLLKRMEELSETNHALRPETTLYNSAILAWLETNCLKGVERAHSVLNGLLGKYQVRLDELSKLSQADEPGHINLAERPNNTSFIPIMAGYSKYGSMEHIGVVEDLLQQIGDLQLAKYQAPPAHRRKMAPIEQNAVATNVLLDLYAQFSRKHPEMIIKSENLLKRMDALGGRARPDAFSYTIALKACAAAGLKDTVPHAMRILEVAKRSYKGNVDLRVYNAALNALASSPAKEEGCLAAEMLLREMVQLPHVQPDTFSFAAVIKACTSVGTMEALIQAEQVLQEAINTGQADSFCFNSLISGFAQLRTEESTALAKEVFFKMQQVSAKDAKVKPTAFTYQNLAMTGSAREGLELLLEMVDRFETSGRREDRPEGKTYSHVISRLFHQENHAEAAEKVEQVLRLKLRVCIEHKGPHPSAYDIDSTVKKMVVAGKVDEASALLDELYEQHPTWARREISTGAYNAILGGLAVKPSADGAAKASGVLEKMEHRHKEDGAEARSSARSYSDCIQVWVGTRLPNCDERAEELVHRMIKEAGANDPDLSRGFNLALKGCKAQAASGYDTDACVQRGARIFGEMMKRERIVNYASYAYMLNLTSYMPEEENRSKIMLYQKLMAQCQKAGLVSPSVLGTFLLLAPAPLAEKVLGVPVEKLNSLTTYKLPSKWTRNVQLKNGPGHNNGRKKKHGRVAA
jgi:hypothetical protein